MPGYSSVCTSKECVMVMNYNSEFLSIYCDNEINPFMGSGVCCPTKYVLYIKLSLFFSEVPGVFDKRAIQKQ
jgi:hypothetical protein